MHDRSRENWFGDKIILEGEGQDHFNARPVPPGKVVLRQDHCNLSTKIERI